jgi:hypothetical protein
MTTTKTPKIPEINGFDAESFLASAGVARQLLEFREKETVFPKEILVRQCSTFNRAA